MDNVRKLLDECKKKAGVESDYALAKTLELPSPRICDYYKGRRAPDEFACLRISEVLGKPLDVVITAVKLDTEKDEKRRLAWERHFRSIGQIAASFMLCAFAFVTLIVTEPAQAQENRGFECCKTVGIQIIRSHRRHFAAPISASSFAPPGCP